MKTNLESYKKRKSEKLYQEEMDSFYEWKLGQQCDPEEELEEIDCLYREDVKEDMFRYIDEVMQSENFEVGDYPFPGSILRGDRKMMITGFPIVAKIYDSSHYPPSKGLEVDLLLCMSRLAMAFHNIRMRTNFRVVKVLMATAEGLSDRTHYITFEAERNMGDSVTFQTKVTIFGAWFPCPKFEILFVRVKPDKNKSENSQPPEFDVKAQVGEARLSRVINKYTIGSRLDLQYCLALHLSQCALVNHNLILLHLSDAKHDIESLKVLKLVKPVAKNPTYLITFEAPLHTRTRKNTVETFETNICMPTLFPTTTIELTSETRVITDKGADNEQRLKRSKKKRPAYEQGLSSNA